MGDGVEDIWVIEYVMNLNQFVVKVVYSCN